MPETKKSILSVVAPITAFIIAYALARYLGLVFLLFLLTGYAGHWFANWYSKRENQSYKLKNVICWSNVVTWISPVVGVGMGIMAYGFGKTENNKKYRNLGIFGLTLSIVNGLLGVYLRYISYI
ncbi:MAG: hypothetical protein KJI71_01090 [Patescibacteria group bacterium]|nr:hypothetical protein [Patescibacteria group bacterium]